MTKCLLATNANQFSSCQHYHTGKSVLFMPDLGLH